MSDGRLPKLSDARFPKLSDVGFPKLSDNTCLVSRRGLFPVIATESLGVYNVKVLECHRHWVGNLRCQSSPL
eukprot:3190254-Alexandrium_andersonii.AAC.1